MTNFPNNFWYVAATSDELTNEPLARTVCQEDIVLYRTSDGDVVALEDYCPHRGLPLSKGKCEGSGIRCGYHGLLINSDGVCDSMPEQPHVANLKGVKSYPVTEEYGFVWIWYGDEESANTSKLPNMPWGKEASEWVFAGGMYAIQCDYRLLIDNLMDLSHETYVHPESIGQAEIDEAKPEVTTGDDDVVTLSRWMQGIYPPPFWEGLYGKKEKVDRWQICRFYPPSNVHIDVGVAKAGTGAPEGDRSHGITGLVVGFITPETDKSCWYFWGMARNFQTNDTELTERICLGQKTIFGQDTDILESQQKNLDKRPDRKVINMDIDKGGFMSRKIIEKLCK